MGISASEIELVDVGQTDAPRDPRSWPRRLIGAWLRPTALWRLAAGAQRRFVGSLRQRRSRARASRRFGPTALAIVAVAAFISLFDNAAFWRGAAQATLLDDHRVGILASLFAIQAATLVIALALVPGRRLLKLSAMLLLSISALCGFFMTTYGTLIDTTMIRNVVETNLQESAPLLTGAFFWHMLVYGVAPSLVVAFAPLSSSAWLPSVLGRVGLIAVSSAALIGTVYANYQPLSFFAHEHREVRLFFNPGYPILSYLDYLLRDDDEVPVERAPLDAKLTSIPRADDRRTLFVLVMGETARADRFQYNGYERATNRYTSELNLVNYSNVTACGTSTADSLPCLFSKFGREAFSHAAAAQNENLFGLLQRLGIESYWLDNSTGCKDVCDAEHFEELAGRHDEGFCDATGCFDEILLRGLDALTADTRKDHFIVLHQRGSHGPAYHTDVPGHLKAYFPECDQSVLRNCSHEEINNAYDNTIVYTDYFISELVGYLDSRAAAFDVAMLYVSDHGESLGENGLYLHGFPYAIAPAEQLRVPMLFWGSPAFFARQGLDPACLRATADRPRDHDSVFHTLLPIFEIDSREYDASLDLFADCRGSRTPFRTSQAWAPRSASP